MHITMLPAYGRTYGTESAILADWNDGKDFQMFSHLKICYCSIRDSEVLKTDFGATHLQFRIHEFRYATLAL